MTLPTVLIPSVNGVTSIINKFLVYSDYSPHKIPPWTAALLASASWIYISVWLFTIEKFFY